MTADREDRGAGYAAHSDTGRARTRNEDAWLARPPLFVVADGMGGHRAGDVASATAVRLIADALGADQAPVPAAIAEAVRSANHAVWREAHERSEHAGMGTTCTVALVDGSRLHIAHVGDSRAYRLRGGRLEQLTADHTLVGSLVRDGRLTEAEARQDDRRHIITRALGVDPEVEVDVATHDLLPSDRLMLCSDGLSGQVDEATITDVLSREPDADRAAGALVELANRAGGVDNVTVVVIDPDRLAARPMDPRGQRSAPPAAISREGDPTVRWRRLAVLLAVVLVAMVGLTLVQGLGGGAAPTPSPTVGPSPTVRPSPSAGRSFPTATPSPLPTPSR